MLCCIKNQAQMDRALQYAERDMNTQDPQQIMQATFNRKLQCCAWGIRNFTSIKNKALCFTVNAQNTGMVCITLGWEDLYIVTLFAPDGSQVAQEREVFFDDLFAAVRRIIETDHSQQQ
jgi:hypothetical protein